MRQIPTWTLRSTDKLGPFLKPSELNCIEELEKRRKEKLTTPRDPRCTTTARTERNGLRVRRSAGPISILILNFIQSYATRPIVDDTGLTGNFEWELAVNTTGQSSEEHDRNMREAVEDDLGLTLESRVSPWEVIVIDDVRIPTPN